MIAFYPAAWTRLLREHGIQIWQVTSWSGKCDHLTYYIDQLVTFVPCNKRLIVHLFNGESREIYEADKGLA